VKFHKLGAWLCLTAGLGLLGTAGYRVWDPFAGARQHYSSSFSNRGALILMSWSASPLRHAPTITIQAVSGSHSRSP
jgi:hypothetical protein